jgi:hypothetical protein
MPEIFFEAFELVAPEVAGTTISAEAASTLAAQQEAARQAAIQQAAAEKAAAEKLAAEEAAKQAAADAAKNRGITSVAEQTTTPQDAFRKAVEEGSVRTTVPQAIPGAGAPSVTNPTYNMFSNNPLTDITTNPGGANQIVTNGFSPITGPTTAPAVTPTWGEAVRPMYQMEAGSPAVGNALTRGMDAATEWMGTNPWTTAGIGYGIAAKTGMLDPKKQSFNDEKYNGPLSRYHMSSDFQARHPDPAQYQYTPRYAGGGIMGYAAGGPVEQMSNNAAIGANTMYPMANMTTSAFATPYQDPKSTNMMAAMTPSGGGTVDAMSGEPNMQGTRLAAGGQVPRYGDGGIFGEISNTVGDALAGVGQTVNNLANGRVSIGRPDTAQTADQVARKYGTMTLAQNNVNPQQYQYSPQYAEGGVARFSKGTPLDFYLDKLGGERERQIAEASNSVGGKGDAGVVRDTDPDTAYLSAPEAAAVRMGKINAKANMQGLTLPRPKPIGRLNLKPQGVQQAAASGSSLDPEMAAAGGIMGASHLGSYAAGGNPRLLKGPGDGMSDNIPAVIADRQPARLADGEFVVPADVVSHLGNGSTDAGAKKLHEMMNKVRKARTGNSKQGKQINPNKFIPR